MKESSSKLVGENSRLSQLKRLGKNDPDSITWPTVFIIEEPAEDLGVPVNHWFTEKQMGRLSEFIRCFTGGAVDPNKKYKLEDTVGRYIMGYIEYDIKTGFNSIKDFKPVTKSTSEAK